MSGKRYGGVAAALALLAVTSACSSSTKSAGGTTTSVGSTGATSASTQALTGAPIKIGIISTDSNAAGTNEDIPQTSKRWQDYVNAHGGINGHPVQVIQKDDSSNPATALQDFETLQSDGVVAIGDYSFVDTAFQKQADAANIPVFDLGTPSLTIMGVDPNFFNPFAATVTGAWGYGKMMQLTGKKNLGFLYCAEVAACAQAVPIIKAEMQSVGANEAYAGSISASAPDYTAQCVAAKQAGVDIMLAASSSPTAGIRVVDDCAQQNFFPMAVLAGQTTPKNILSDKNIHSAFGANLTIPYFVHTPATAAFHAAMDSYIPQAFGGGFSLILDWTGLVGIQTAAQLGIPAGATPSTQSMYNGAYSVKDNTLGGLVGPVTWTQGKGHHTNCEFFFGMSNAQFTAQYGTQPYCDAADTAS